MLLDGSGDDAATDIGHAQAATGEQGLAPRIGAPTRAEDREEGTPMTADLTADEIRSLLDLEPNATCGQCA